MQLVNFLFFITMKNDFLMENFSARLDCLLFKIKNFSSSFDAKTMKVLKNFK